MAHYFMYQIEIYPDCTHCSACEKQDVEGHRGGTCKFWEDYQFLIRWVKPPFRAPTRQGKRVCSV